KLTKVEGAKEQYNNTEAKISALSSLVEQLKEMNKKIAQTEINEAENQKQFDELLEQLTTCPMCSSTLVMETKDHLLESYKE
ncbi:MAG TPA: hypothetical protein VMW74_09120, partial [Nitrosopumilaceae archaeon]|nr:hypothetical protein [Nitrosopumilaceae archaeon]